MRQSFFEKLNKKELELVKAGEASVNATIQELAASGHGYALKCCSDNGKETEKDGTTTHPVSYTHLTLPTKRIV